MISEVKLRITRRFIEILIEDVGLRDDKLVRIRKESDQTKEALAQSRKEASEVQIKAVALQEKISSREKKLKRFGRQFEIDRYVIPFVLLVALFSGTIIASQLDLPLNPAIGWIALVLLIAYLIYYSWVYYLSQSKEDVD